jgi:hypothetical protein
MIDEDKKLLELSLEAITKLEKEKEEYLTNLGKAEELKIREEKIKGRENEIKKKEDYSRSIISTIGKILKVNMTKNMSDLEYAEELLSHSVTQINDEKPEVGELKNVKQLIKSIDSNRLFENSSQLKIPDSVTKKDFNIEKIALDSKPNAESNEKKQNLEPKDTVEIYISPWQHQRFKEVLKDVLPLLPNYYYSENANQTVSRSIFYNKRHILFQLGNLTYPLSYISPLIKQQNFSNKQSLKSLDSDISSFSFHLQFGASQLPTFYQSYTSAAYPNIVGTGGFHPFLPIFITVDKARRMKALFFYFFFIFVLF